MSTSNGTRPLQLQDGESSTYVKQQMGHSSIQLTVDRYGHFIPGADRAAVDRLASATTAPSKEPRQPHSHESNFDVTKTVEVVRK